MEFLAETVPGLLTAIMSLVILNICFSVKRLLSTSEERETSEANNQEESVVSESLIFTTFHPFNCSIHA